MNKEIYISLIKQLKNECPGFRYIAIDNGQLDAVSERPAIDCPACLININYPSCTDLTDYEQLVRANIILKLVFRPAGETGNLSPRTILLKSLDHLDYVESVQNALQGCDLDGTVSAISRVNAIRTVRTDRLLVYAITYNTTFQEIQE